jgi:uncharacterized Zn finger protein
VGGAGGSGWWQRTEAFGEDDLLELTGRERLERGRALAETIDDLYEDEWSIWGTVHDDGGKAYLAMVHHVGPPLSCECDCPDGAPGTWCEHVVAVGLAYLEEG